MSLTEWGNFYLIPPSAIDMLDVISEHVVRTYRHGPSHIELAKELWSLAGHADQATRLSMLTSAIYDRVEPVLNEVDITQLLDAIAGLEAAADAALLDREGHVRTDLLDSLRSRAKILDFGGDHATARLAVLNSFARISALRVALEDARTSNLFILID